MTHKPSLVQLTIEGTVSLLEVTSIYLRIPHDNHEELLRAYLIIALGVNPLGATEAARFGSKPGDTFDSINPGVRFPPKSIGV